MRNILKLFIISIVLFGCSSPKPEPMPQASRSILVYMAADNNLYSYAQDNLKKMVESAKKGSFGSNRLIVYIDSPGNALPKLIEITPEGDGQKVLKQYDEEQNSASKEVLNNAINDFMELAPANEYGLVLWSHASGWMFQSVNIKSGFRMSEKPTDVFGIELEDGYVSDPPTKSFGIASYQGRTSAIDIPDLAAGIPDNLFEFIIFDCCYMGSVEVAYELRNKAHYIIASATEILASGFPYELCLPYLFKPTADLESVCKSYYDYYNNQSNQIERSATISLVKCSELEPLLNSVSAIVKNHPEEIGAITLSNMQCFDRYDNHFIYDLGQFVETISTDEEFNAFNEILKRAVVTKYNTKKFISFDIKEFCGVSSYIPGKLKYNGADALYYTTAWGAGYTK